MGNSASKAVKRTSKEAVPKEMFSAVKAEQSGAARVRPAPSSAPASETKDESIMKDGRDPNLIQNLASLGQVQLPHRPGSKAINLDRKMLDILDKRKAHEQSIETANKNVMSASALAILLDERKTLQRPEFEALAKEYGIDVEIVDDLARVLNTPSVTSVRTRKEELDEVQVARWVDASPNEPARIASS